MQIVFLVVQTDENGRSDINVYGSRSAAEGYVDSMREEYPEDKFDIEEKEIKN